jgi:CsoR family transcriptional regulator, copper-sensing transcriptional repressor
MDERKTHAACGKDKDDLLKRLKRIEGQVRGIYKMVEDDRYCVDVIIQVSAATAALNKVSLALLERHTQSCVTDAIHEGNGEESVRELMDVVKKMLT